MLWKDTTGPGVHPTRGSDSVKVVKPVEIRTARTTATVGPSRSRFTVTRVRDSVALALALPYGTVASQRDVDDVGLRARSALQCRIAEFGMLHRLLPASSVKDRPGGSEGVAAAATTKRQNSDETPVRRSEDRSTTAEDRSEGAPPLATTPESGPRPVLGGVRTFQEDRAEAARRGSGENPKCAPAYPSVRGPGFGVKYRSPGGR